MSAEADILAQITGFFDRIGIPWKSGQLKKPTALPGIRIKHGVLKFDPDKLQWPGDLLHEAAHIALAAPSARAEVCSRDTDPPAEEMAAMAWSYAAALACGIPPEVVFHEGGYQTGGAHLMAQYATGGGYGVPMLYWYRMTREFPQITSWLREVEDPTAALSQP